MIFKHSIIYLIGRIIPAIISLVSIMIFTRILDPTQYGLYAYIIAGVNIINVICFQWLNLSLGRFLPGNEDNEKELLSTTFVGFFILIALTSILSIPVIIYYSKRILIKYILLTLIVSWTQAWFDLNLRIVNIKLLPVKYGVINSLRALLSLAIGILLFFMGLGVSGIVLGTIVGLTVSSLMVINNWYGIRITNYNKKILKSLINYGAPLALTFLLTLILDISDRFFLGYFVNVKAVGNYAVTYDFAQASLGVLLNIVHLATFPIAVLVLETKGVQAARAQIRKNGLLLVLIAVPITLGYIMLSNNIIYVVFGPEYRNEGEIIMNIIALAVFFSCLKCYYFDYSFQLGRKLSSQVLSVFLASMTNVVCNYFWIPIWSVKGAAYSTLIAFIIGLLSSWYLGNRIFKLPPFHKETYKVIIASVIMSCCLYSVKHWRGTSALGIQLVLGITIYLILLYFLDINRIQKHLKKIIEVKLIHGD